jgi:O-antigen chain-terminating methyltransferase
VLRPARGVTTHQVIVNESLVQALQQVDYLRRHPTGEPQPPPQPLLDPPAVAIAALDVMVQALREEVATLRRQLAAHRPAAATLDDTLYGAFEDAFRGDADEIRTRLAAYVDELAQVAQGGGRVLDVGCGAGDLVKLLVDADVDAYGVELNDDLAAKARSLRLDVITGDAFEHLKAVDPGSLAAVTVIHVIEHLPPADAVWLVDLAHRALRPGGRLVIETPNPMTWAVGANWFHLDPTHLRPVHPLYLEFLARQRGFEPVELRWLHPATPAAIPAPAADADPALAAVVEKLNELNAGPQDYAVVATRPLD